MTSYGIDYESQKFDDELFELVDHCEMDHEFECPMTTLAEVRQAHVRRHRVHNDWNHTHKNTNYPAATYH